ncbi:hypothetical protein FI667_g1383, partial [Globisporangium splendens]
MSNHNASNSFFCGSHQMESSLIAACYTSDLAAVRALLQQRDGSVCHLIPDMLSLALKEGHIGIAAALLDAASIHFLGATDWEELTRSMRWQLFVMLAISKGDVAVLEFVVDHAPKYAVLDLDADVSPLGPKWNHHKGWY